MSVHTRYTAALVVVLSSVSLAAAPAALAKPLGGPTFTPAHIAALEAARNSVDATTIAPTPLHGSAGRVAPVVLSHAAQAHTGGSRYISATVSPSSQSGSSGSSWSTGAVLFTALVGIAAVAGLGVLLVGAVTRTRRRHAIGSH